MKIAIYYNVPRGGAKRAINQMAKCLAERGHTLLEIAPSTAETKWESLAKYTIKQKIWPFEWPVWRSRVPLLSPYLQFITSLLGTYRYHRLSREIAQWLVAEDIEILFANDCSFFLNPIIVGYSKIPSLLYIHHGSHLSCNAVAFNPSSERIPFVERLKGIYYFPAKKGWDLILEKNEKWAACRADRIACNSAVAQKLIFDAYGTKSYIIPIGVDSNKFLPLESGKKNYVMSAGAITRHKGFDFLIRSLGTISQEHRPDLIIASIYTPEEETSYLNNLAREHDVGLKIISPKSDEELIRLYSEAKVFLFAAYQEAFGLVVLEAMACGTPVIGVQDGGYSDSIVNGETGFVTKRDPKIFGEVVDGMIENPKCYSQMGKQARYQIEKNWSLDQTVQILEGNLFEAAKVKHK